MPAITGAGNDYVDGTGSNDTPGGGDGSDVLVGVADCYSFGD